MNTKLLFLFLLFPLNSTVHTWPFCWKHELTFFFYRSIYLSIYLSNHLSQVWLCEFKFYFKVYNASLSLVILLIKLSQIWSLEADSRPYLCPCDMCPFKCFLSFWRGQMLQSHFVLHRTSPWVSCFPNNLTNVFAYWHIYVKIKNFR